MNDCLILILVYRYCSISSGSLGTPPPFGFVNTYSLKYILKKKERDEEAVIWFSQYHKKEKKRRGSTLLYSNDEEEDDGCCFGLGRRCFFSAADRYLYCGRSKPKYWFIDDGL